MKHSNEAVDLVRAQIIGEIRDILEVAIDRNEKRSCGSMERQYFYGGMVTCAYSLLAKLDELMVDKSGK